MLKFKQTLAFKSLQLFFSVFMALYPILCLYTGFYKFTIGDLGLMFFMVLGLLRLPKIDSRFRITIIFLIYTAIVFLVNLMIVQTMQISAFTSFFFRFIKLCFYLICAFTCGRTYFNTKYFQKTIIKISIVLCAFLFFQYIAYYGAGQIVLGRLPGLSVYIEDYQEIDYEKFYSFNFRPSSLFLEPSQFCQYMAVPITLTLFSKEISKKKKLFLVALFVTGILFSTSGQGIFYLAIIFVMYGLFEIRNKGITIAFFAIVIFAGLVAYSNIDAVKFAVDRLLFGADAFEARIGTYKYISEMKNLHLFFGYGYGVLPTNEYFAGMPYVWYGCGLLGLLLVLGMFFSLYRKAESAKAKVVCVVFLVAFFVTSLFYNYMLFWYFTIIISTQNFEYKSKANRLEFKKNIREDRE